MNPAGTALTLADELILLGYRPDGRPSVGAAELAAGVAGALLADLALASRIHCPAGRVSALSAEPTGEAELDAALDRVATATKPRKPRYWVDRLSSTKVVRRHLDGLAGRGILGHRPVRFLGITWAVRRPELDPEPENEIRSRLTGVVAGDRTADERRVVLLALADALGLSRKMFPAYDRKELKARLKRLTEGEWEAEAVREAIVAARAIAASVATSAAIAAGAASSGN